VFAAPLSVLVTYRRLLARTMAGTGLRREPSRTL
jgi:hypothetical protein